MKERIKFSKDQLKQIGIKDKPRDLMTISTGQFKLKQEISKLGNKIYWLRNDVTNAKTKYTKLENEKDAIFIGMGLKIVKKEEGEVEWKKKEMENAMEVVMRLP